MTPRRVLPNLAACLVLLLGILCTRAYAQDPDIPSAQQMQPSELARMLAAPESSKPLILQVGSRVLYAEAHIPGAEYVGAGGSETGRAAIRERLKRVDHDQPIVIYCGCCPWPKCPNIRAANAEIAALGFKRVKALHIVDNFGTDWVAQGYPVAKGQ